MNPNDSGIVLPGDKPLTLKEVIPGLYAVENAYQKDAGFFSQGREKKMEPIAPQITIDDFAKIDLRVAKILTAEDVPDAKKMLKLTLDVGDGTPKTVFAGIKAYYVPESLIGRQVIYVANLAPRQMKFGLSEGMIVAASGEGKESGVFLIHPDIGTHSQPEPGYRVH